MPVGVQVVGRHWQERQVLAVMKTLERVRGSQAHRLRQFNEQMTALTNENMRLRDERTRIVTPTCITASVLWQHADVRIEGRGGNAFILRDWTDEEIELLVARLRAMQEGRDARDAGVNVEGAGE